jgi:hypothetical protein
MDSSLSNIIDHRSNFISRSSLLSRFLEEAWGRPYQLGQWDCILFIAAWADRLMTQGGGASRAPSLTAALHGQYTTEAGAIRQLAPNGINAAIQAALTRRGWKERLPVDGFQPGDIILTDLHHPGIYDGRSILAQPARSSGLLHLYPSHGVLALRWPTSGSRT